MSKLKPRGPLTASTLEGLVIQIQNREPRGSTQVTMIDGVPHRLRRGKLVPIPAEWFGKVTHKQTIRKRDSKQGQGSSYVSKAQR